MTIYTSYRWSLLLSALEPSAGSTGPGYWCHWLPSTARQRHADVGSDNSATSQRRSWFVSERGLFGRVVIPLCFHLFLSLRCSPAPKMVPSGAAFYWLSGMKTSDVLERVWGNVYLNTRLTWPPSCFQHEAA